MKVVEFFLMSGMGKSVSRWGVHVGMSSLLVLCSSCCSTRTIHVVDGDDGKGATTIDSKCNLALSLVQFARGKVSSVKFVPDYGETEHQTDYPF